MENINNTITKPTVITMAEGKQSIIDTLKTIQLPLFLLETIIKDIYNEVSFQARNEFEYIKIEYEKALAEEKANEKKESTEK